LTARSFRIELPLPISLNNAYANRKPRLGSRGGRYPTKKHLLWKMAAAWELKIAKPVKISGPYTFQIIVPMGMRGDASNRIKLVEDLLVSHGVTDDDSKCVDSRASKSGSVPKGRCVVIVQAACLDEVIR
jgi:Holliday junction resolvase RusA-like endonuclease